MTHKCAACDGITIQRGDGLYPWPVRSGVYEQCSVCKGTGNKPAETVCAHCFVLQAQIQQLERELESTRRMVAKQIDTCYEMLSHLDPGPDKRLVVESLSQQQMSDR